MVATYLQHHPSQHMFTIQSPMRLRRFPQWIARRDRHADPAVADVTIQLVEFTRTCNRVEGMQAERAPLDGNRLDTIRVSHASFGSHEVETALELVASGEREDTIESVWRERPELIDRFRAARVDHTMCAELSDQSCRRCAGCCRDDVGAALNGELNRHGADGTRGAEDQHGMARA